MPPAAAPARRVVLAPPQAWDEARLMDAARALPDAGAPLRPGDEVAGLVVVGVEPAPGAPHRDTAFEIRPRPRPLDAPLVDVAVLLDASESMGLAWSQDLTRAEAAHEALASFLRRGGAGVATVTVLAYARDARVLAGPAAPGTLDAPPLPAPKGPSRTGAALDATLARLCEHARDDRLQVVLLLTDSLGGDEVEARAAAERAARLGIHVHVLAFAPEADPLLEEVALRTRGSLQLATLPLTLDFVHQPGSDAS